MGFWIPLLRRYGSIRYANKNARRHCPNRNECYKGRNEWKEIDKDCLEKPCRDWLKADRKEIDNTRAVKSKGHFEKVKVVRFFLRPTGIRQWRGCVCLSIRSEQ